MLSTPTHRLVEISHLPHNVTVSSHRSDKLPQLVELICALAKLTLEKGHLLLLLLVVPLERPQLVLQSASVRCLPLERVCQVGQLFADELKLLIELL